MIAVLYYQCILTGVTVMVAIIIGILQFLNMIAAIKPNLKGPFWHGVDVAGDNYDVIGGSICGSFIVFGVLAVLCYKPWRRRVDAKRGLLSTGEAIYEGNEGHGNPEVLIELEPEPERSEGTDLKGGATRSEVYASSSAFA